MGSKSISGEDHVIDDELLPNSNTALAPKLPPSSSDVSVGGLHRSLSSTTADGNGPDNDSLGTVRLSDVVEPIINKLEAREGCRSQGDGSDRENMDSTNYNPGDTKLVVTKTNRDILRKSADEQDAHCASNIRLTPPAYSPRTLHPIPVPVNAVIIDPRASFSSIDHPLSPGSIPASLASCKNAHLLSSAPFSRVTHDKDAEGEESTKHVTDPLGQTSETEVEEAERFRQLGRLFVASTVPLRPVRPHGQPTMIRRQHEALTNGPTTASQPMYLLQDSFLGDEYEERDSYEEAPDFPYHPANWTKLPGPGLATPPPPQPPSGDEERLYQERAGAA
ncbi:hypothetical protein FRB97_006032 [Tulasnella sp. 331]|nr:hypothetical protein FRB97_006032 [Tulasnella sp. 331]